MKADFSVPQAVLAEYGADDAHIELLSGGRTNRTMRVRAGRDLVLQQMLGTGHFDLLGVMENLVRVTAHIDWRRQVAGVGQQSWYPLLMPTNTGKPFIMTAEGDVWRCFNYRTGQIVRSSQPLATLASAGAMYGRFAAATFDLGGPPLVKTAPDFHDLDQVRSVFEHDLDHASAERSAPIHAVADELQELISAVEQRCSDDNVAYRPDRVVHNDTKLSNVLFDRDHGRATAVLDLDMAMMGPCWHDVGDLMRSACWHAPNAAQDPACSTELFDAVVGAYVEAAGDTLTHDDVATFAVAGPRLSLELGLRYLNDHVRAEPQLQVDGVDGHLKRGLANLKLAHEMIAAYDALRQVVDGFIAER